MVKSGVAYLAGSALSTNADGIFAWNPPAVEPDHCVQANVYAFGGHLASAFVDPVATQMWINNDDQNANNDLKFTSLAGIAYPVAGAAWQPLTLQNGWSAASNPDCTVGAPAYYLNNGVVYLSGAASSQTGGGVLATLPPAARPTHWLYLMVNTQHGHASLSISPTGQLTLFGGPSQPEETALSGISYQTTS